VKQERLSRFMQLQESISAEKLNQKIGRIEMVLVDEVDGDQAIGRTSADAPDIDGVVYLADAEGLQVGDLVEVEITDADGHDLWAAPPNRD
jgi:ribosomal protein S12 methylthiotransferase